MTPTIKNKILLLTLFAVLLGLVTRVVASGDSSIVRIGPLARKYAGFYLTGGFCVEYAPQRICRGALTTGLNLTSSRLGTAMLYNAIPFYTAEVFIQQHFRRRRKVQPLVLFSLGYMRANYGDKAFNGVSAGSALLALEGGAQLAVKNPVRFTLGYNLITGTGLKGPGTLYPLYFQIKWTLALQYRQRR